MERDHDPRAADDDAKRTHSIEQMGEYLRDQARLAAAYFTQCQQEGFKREEAMRLTLAMQTERFRALFDLRPKPEG